jgi:hypothetical protein
MNLVARTAFLSPLTSGEVRSPSPADALGRMSFAPPSRRPKHWHFLARNHTNAGRIEREYSLCPLFCGVGNSSVGRGFVRAPPLTLPQALEPNRWSRRCGQKGMKPSGWNSLAQKSK